MATLFQNNYVTDQPRRGGPKNHYSPHPPAKFDMVKMFGKKPAKGFVHKKSSYTAFLSRDITEISG